MTITKCVFDSIKHGLPAVSEPTASAPDLDSAGGDSAAASASALRQLDEARAILEAKQPFACLDLLMQSVASAEQQHLYPLQRRGLALLAEVFTTALGNAEQALDPTLAEILPQALADHNAERRGCVELVYAQTLLALHKAEDARAWLTRAEQGTWCD